MNLVKSGADSTPSVLEALLRFSLTEIKVERNKRYGGADSAFHLAVLAIVILGA